MIFSPELLCHSDINFQFLMILNPSKRKTKKVVLMMALTEAEAFILRLLQVKRTELLIFS